MHTQKKHNHSMIIHIKYNGEYGSNLQRIGLISTIDELDES